MEPRASYDPEAQAIYILLSDKPYAFGEDIDHERRIDYSDDRTPIGVELLSVDEGVDLSDIPRPDLIASILKSYNIRILV